MKRHTLTNITISPNLAYCHTEVSFWEKPLTAAPVIEALNILYADAEAKDVSDWDGDDQDDHSDTIRAIALAIELAEHADFDMPSGRRDVMVCGVKIGHIHIEHTEVFVI